MEKLTSILVIVDPHIEMNRTIGKALVLARSFGAKLELFLCDSTQANVLKHSYVTQEVERVGKATAASHAGEMAQPSLHAQNLEQERQACLADGMRYLQALKESLNANDLSISIDVACHSPLFESIVHKVRETAPDLVIKSASGRHPMRRISFDDNDWQLARACPATLMLTRGRLWREQPRFAAAVDLDETETSTLARMIMHTSDFLAVGCRATVDVLFSEPDYGNLTAHAARRSRLYQLAFEHQVEAPNVHLLQGEPSQTLPKFAVEQNYDVLVLGALTRRTGLAALIGTLTSSLVDALDCDFVLVKPVNFEARSIQPQQSAAC